VERNGDFEAFGAGHGRRLIHLAEPLLGDRGAAEDLTQDVLARAYLRWDRVEREDPYAYVRRALINARIDRWRRRLPIPVADLGPDRVVADHAQGVADREHLFAALRLVIHGKHLPAETVRFRTLKGWTFYYLWVPITVADPSARYVGVVAYDRNGTKLDQFGVG
jgi:DNA-directed RNA polymerase specialized sigma24 family protein